MMRGEPVRFVGGMRYAATGGVFSGGMNLSWPLATLEIQDDEIRISPRSLLQRGRLLGLRPVEIPFSRISKVEAGFGLSKAGIRFRADASGDGTVFWALGRTRSAVVDALRTAGLDVEERA
jgi:hypothetical protein